MTRKQLVEALRVIHEGDEITKIVSRAKRIDISFRSAGKDCLLVVPNPPTQQNDHRNTKNKPERIVVGFNKYGKPIYSSDPTIPADDNRPTSPDPIRSTEGGEDDDSF